MKFRWILLLLLGTVASAQELYVPTGPATVKKVALVSGVNVLLNMNGATKSMVIVIPGALFAEADPVIGQLAYDDCIAHGGNAIACEVKRSEAVTNDIYARVKLVMETIPEVDLIANKLVRVN